MDILDLYSDYGVEVAGDGDRHFRPGWVNVPCPFCTGNPGHHLGFNEFGKYFYCFRCKHHPTVHTLSTLLKVPYKQAETLAQTYKIYEADPSLAGVDKLLKIGTQEFKFPSDTGDLKKSHMNYLFDRNFNPTKIQKIYGIMGTSPLSRLKVAEGKSLKFSHRVLMPILWRGEVVSYTGRDYTGKQTYKYLTCPMEREKVHHKFIVYCAGGNLSRDRIGVWVEGPMDVWRVGARAFSTFGISYTKEQMKLIASSFDKVFIWFDPDPQAQVQAEAAARELMFRGVEACLINTDFDPADMHPEDVSELLRDLNLK